MRLKILLLVWLATFVTSLFFSQNAFAAKVMQVKGKQVLIDLEGDEANVGDKYFVMLSGKKRGLVTIAKVKNSRAIATLDKGKAEKNASLQLAKAAAVAGGGSSKASNRTARKSSKSGGGTTIGLLAGYSMNSQEAKVINAARDVDTAKMSGSGFSLLGFADIPYSGNLSLVGRGGVETFNVTGTSSKGYCSGSPTTSCMTEIMYLTLDALISYKFGSGTFVPFVAGGLGIYYPLSKSTTALSPDIGMSTVFLANVGANYNLSSTSYIPIILEYGMFPPGPDVSTSIIALRVGYGMSF